MYEESRNEDDRGSIGDEAVEDEEEVGEEGDDEEGGEKIDCEDPFSLSRAGTPPSETIADVAERRLNDDVSISLLLLVMSICLESENLKESASILLRFLKGQLEGRGVDVRATGGVLSDAVKSALSEDP